MCLSSYIEADVYRRREFPDLDDLVDLELKRRIGDDAVRWMGYDRTGYVRRAMNGNGEELISAGARWVEPPPDNELTLKDKPIIIRSAILFLIKRRP